MKHRKNLLFATKVKITVPETIIRDAPTPFVLHSNRRNTFTKRTVYAITMGQAYRRYASNLCLLDTLVPVPWYSCLQIDLTKQRGLTDGLKISHRDTQQDSPNVILERKQMLSSGNS